jgi:HTH-type transcriptional regulator/antitoxin HigA
MEAVIDRDVVSKITTYFQALNSLVPLRPVTNEEEYAKAVSALNQLLDVGAADEDHPLAGLVNAVGALIAIYEDLHNPPEKVAPAAVLRLLMDQHELSQSDLPEVGTQGVVSEVLSGKRDLNVRQIKLLSGRFNVPASVFL